MMNLLAPILSFFNGRIWIVQLALVVLLTLLVHYVVGSICRRLISKFERTENRWDDAIVLSLLRPIIALIWLVGSWFVLAIGLKEFGVAHFFRIIVPFLQLSVIAIVVWFLLRLIKQSEAILGQKKEGKKALDLTTLHAVAQLVRLIVFLVAILVVLQTLNVRIGGVLAFGGIGGLVLGFAAKDLLANFFGGLMIYLDRPFSVGDWIRSPDRKIEGTVEYIGWRLCRIRTFDSRPLYVPNSVFSTVSVENPSRMQNRRIYTKVGLRYDDATKVGTILQAITDMLKTHPEIDPQKTLMVNLIEFGPSSLNFMIYTFTKTTNWVKYQAIQQDVFLKVIEIITAHKAECAFPTSTLHVPSGIALKKNPVT